jgi:E3 ubiquitin-protein ligase EDD1
VGQLLNSAWNLTDTCRFKILQPPKKPKLPELPKASKDKQKEDNDSASMPPPPSPASSTCSDGSLSSPGEFFYKLKGYLLEATDCHVSQGCQIFLGT